MLTWQNTGDPCTPETLTFVDHLMPTRIGYTTAFGPNISAIYTSNPTITVAADTGVFASRPVLPRFNGRAAIHFFAVEKVVSTSRQR